jgi:TolA-binding protein
MHRFGWTVAILAITASPAFAARDTAQELKFVEGLRGLGYYDLANEHLETLRKDPAAPEDLRAVIDYELGRGMVEEAGKLADLERRADLLEKARARLDAFTRDRPMHAQFAAAQAQKATMLIQRGEVAKIRAEEAEEPADREAKLADARGSYQAARQALDEAIARLQEQFKQYPPFLDRKDPKRIEKEGVLSALMKADFQRATVDYAEAHTYPEGNEKRNALLNEALAKFAAISSSYRQQMVGLYAKMWQGKAFEEQGKLTEAMGLYNQLYDDSNRDPLMSELKRHVAFFRILVHEKRGDFALAADDAARWLAGNPGHEQTTNGLGVMLHRAKNMDAQLRRDKEKIAPADREAASKAIREDLRRVVRVYSEHKAEALKMLEEYDPKGKLKAEDIAKMGYDEAVAAGESLINTQDYDEAVRALRVAVERALDDAGKATRDKRQQLVDKALRARYLMAYCYYMTQQYYHAVVICEQIARRYPQSGLAPKACEIALAAHVGAYNAFQAIDRASDLDRLLAFADYVAKTWPDDDQGNAARMSIGAIKLGQGKYQEAIDALGAVGTSSGRKTEAQSQSARARWRWSLTLREQGKGPEADEQAKQAIAEAQAAYQARLGRKDPATDLQRIDNARDLCEMLMESGRAEEALGIIEPLAAQLTAMSRPASLQDRYAKVLATLLQAHIRAGRVDAAIGDIATLQKANTDPEMLVRLYVDLGRLLEKEMADLKAKGDTSKLDKVRADYEAFLAELIKNEQGQTYESLQWAGEALLTLGKYEQANALFEKILGKYSEEIGFDYKKLQRTRLRLVTSLRGLKDFSKARTTLQELLPDKSKGEKSLMEALVEDCRISSDAARAGAGSWDDAIGKWNGLAKSLGTIRPRPPEYFDAYMAIAEGLAAQGDGAKAKLSLNNIMRLNQKSMSPEYVAKFKELLGSIR